MFYYNLVYNLLKIIPNKQIKVQKIFKFSRFNFTFGICFNKQKTIYKLYVEIISFSNIGDSSNKILIKFNIDLFNISV